jgi:hypothetical protein
MNETKKHYSNCVTPSGQFVYGIHKPVYAVTNLRKNDKIVPLGMFEDGSINNNLFNFPTEDVIVENADWIFEIPNPLPFRGSTYIDKEWADAGADDYSRIRISQPENFSFTQLVKTKRDAPDLFSELPQPILLALATCSTDPVDLMTLAAISCELISDQNGQILGMKYKKLADGRVKAVISDHPLFEAVANNPNLPDSYKEAMVLRPGAQGTSEIVGEWSEDGHTHVYEYLRKNSYIAGGHYAANMSDDAVRYSISSLIPEDMVALRHLYYQRSYLKISELLEIPITRRRDTFSQAELEELRLRLLEQIASKGIEKYSTLWGWNFGFDYAPTNYRLHASHQQIHQQYAMIPESVEAYSGNLNNSVGTIPSFSSGDMVAAVIEDYHLHYTSDFFNDYFSAIINNRRMDDRKDLDSSLIVWQDDNTILFVPKAQTSQWELQLMTKKNVFGFLPGNILETDSEYRQSLDSAILIAQQVLERLGAKMVTSIEYSKRISSEKEHKQPLLYSFLPKMPQSPGAFSEAQLRFINGHYPEDFAAVCRRWL